MKPWSANGEKRMFMSKMTTRRLQARDDTESGERRASGNEAANSRNLQLMVAVGGVVR